MNTPKLRFVKSAHYHELINLYHLAPAALSGSVSHHTKYDRMVWASKEFAKAHSYVTSSGAYKDLAAALCAY